MNNAITIRRTLVCRISPEYNNITFVFDNKYDESEEIFKKSYEFNFITNILNTRCIKSLHCHGPCSLKNNK